jgi:hypothetical protein
MAYNGSDMYYEESSSDTTVPVRFKQKGKKNTLEERVREYTGYLQVRNLFCTLLLKSLHISK